MSDTTHDAIDEEARILAEQAEMAESIESQRTMALTETVHVSIPSDPEAAKTFTVPDAHEPPVDVADRLVETLPITVAKRAGNRPDRDAYAAELAAAVVEAEKELARDQKALDKARAEVERLEDWVAFDQGRIESRIKSRDHFDRLRAKAAK